MLLFRYDQLDINQAYLTLASLPDLLGMVSIHVANMYGTQPYRAAGKAFSIDSHSVDLEWTTVNLIHERSTWPFISYPKETLLCFAFQYVKLSAQLCVLVIGVCVERRSGQFCVCWVLLNLVHQPRTFGLGIHLQHDIEAFCHKSQAGTFAMTASKDLLILLRLKILYKGGREGWGILYPRHALSRSPWLDPTRP